MTNCVVPSRAGHQQGFGVYSEQDGNCGSWNPVTGPNFHPQGPTLAALFRRAWQGAQVGAEKLFPRSLPNSSCFHCSSNVSHFVCWWTPNNPSGFSACHSNVSSFQRLPWHSPTVPNPHKIKECLDWCGLHLVFKSIMMFTHYIYLL